LRNYGDVDSKFRFVILAAKRAKQLLRGAKPKVKTRSRNPIRIAQQELQDGLVDYSIVADLKEEAPEVEEQVFLGDDLGGEVETAEVAGAADDEEKDGEAHSRDKDEDEEDAEDEEDENGEEGGGEGEVDV
jgi:DNA-directed RNA polymerase omega subunit